MHEWHTNNGTNITRLIDDMIWFEFDTDHSGRLYVDNVEVTNRIFESESEARNYVTGSSYGTTCARIAAYHKGKLTKSYSDAFSRFCEHKKDYDSFSRMLTLGYGRTSEKVTCPNCKSSINLRYGSRFKKCPVCNSKDIISKSNWNKLESKKNAMIKASLALQNEAEKNGVMFICGIEWHC